MGSLSQFFTALGRLVSQTAGQPPAEQLRALGTHYDTIFPGLPASGTVAMRTEQP